MPFEFHLTDILKPHPYSRVLWLPKFIHAFYRAAKSIAYLNFLCDTVYLVAATRMAHVMDVLRTPYFRAVPRVAYLKVLWRTGHCR